MYCLLLSITVILHNKLFQVSHVKENRKNNTERETYFDSHVRELRNKFHKVLIIRPNTTMQIWYNKLLLFVTCFGCPDQPSAGRCRTHKKDLNGERPVFIVARDCLA